MNEPVERAKQQVAALCWRNDPVLQVLLITSLKAQRWILPKGWPHPELTLAQSAAVEAHEEAGMMGEVSPVALGNYRYIKDKAGSALPIRVDVFALKVCGQSHHWAEKGTRKLLWLPPVQATHRVAEAGLKQLLLHFQGTLQVA